MEQIQDPHASWDPSDGPEPTIVEWCSLDLGDYPDLRAVVRRHEGSGGACDVIWRRTRVIRFCHLNLTTDDDYLWRETITMADTLLRELIPFGINIGVPCRVLESALYLILFKSGAHYQFGEYDQAESGCTDIDMVGDEPERYGFKRDCDPLMMILTYSEKVRRDVDRARERLMEEEEGIAEVSEWLDDGVYGERRTAAGDPNFWVLASIICTSETPSPSSSLESDQEIDMDEPGDVVESSDVE